MPSVALEPTVTNPKKILIVDDSFIMRRLIAEIVESDPDFRIVDSAENGKIALRKVRETKPDLVLLDLEMPEMSGLDTLRRLGLRSQCKVVVLSFMTSENSGESAEARRLGAVDVLQKPAGSVSLDINARMGDELLRRLRGVVGLRMRGTQSAADTASSNAETSTASDDEQSSLKILLHSREVMLANLSFRGRHRIRRRVEPGLLQPSCAKDTAPEAAYLWRSSVRYFRGLQPGNHRTHSCRVGPRQGRIRLGVRISHR